MSEREPKTNTQSEIVAKNPEFPVIVESIKHVCTGYCHPQSGLDRVDNFPPPDSLIIKS